MIPVHNIYIIKKFPKVYPLSTRISTLKTIFYLVNILKLTMLYCDVSNCDCCKRIRVNHDNNLFEKIYCNVVKRTRLCGINHDSLKYCCADICNGETIYCTKRPTQISYYTTHHAEKVYGIFTLIKKNLMLLYVIFDTTMYLMRIVSIYYELFFFILCVFKYSFPLSNSSFNK